MHVLLVDDHPIMRLGARQLVEREWAGVMVHEAETIADAVRLVGQHPFDAVVLDIELPDSTGIEGVSRMLRVAAGTPILVMSQNSESAYASRLFQLGVRGYLPKDRASTDLVVALRRVLGGGRYVTDSLADHLAGRLDGQRASAGLPHESLSAQEFRVMQLIAAGVAPARIAELMNLSVKTVGSYRARIFEKTGWRTTVELTKYCVQHRLTGGE